MHLVDSYQQPPGCCRLCRSSAHLPVVDTLQDIDNEGYEGRLYICSECIGHLADLVGWISPAKFKATRTELNRLKRKNDELKNEFEAAKEFVREAFTPDVVEEAAAS